jgi:serine/threonine-protein kinase
VLVEVAQALAHLHQHGLVHGGVRPEKVLLQTDPSSPCSFTSKVSDCGLPALLGSAGGQGGAGAGSVAHLAPELLERGGARATAAADVFAFGVMMWELYTGRRAYDCASRRVSPGLPCRPALACP